MTTINGFTPSYDNNGNVLNDNSHTYSWDSEGRPATIDSVNLTYDALGRMVEQNRNGVYTQFVYAPTGQKIQIMNGQATTKSLVALPGGGQAVYTATGGLYYDHPDHLGSFRFASTSARTMYFDLAHAPFGEVYANSGSTDPAFTSQRQDTVAGLYDFPAREYSIQGRWPSPDPAGLGSVDPTNPQSWNRYAYVLNNPMTLTDPLGLVCSGNAGPGVGDTPCNPGNSGGGGGSGSFGGYGTFGLMGIPVTSGPQYGWSLTGMVPGPSMSDYISNTPGLLDGMYSVTSAIGIMTWGLVPGTVIGNGLDLVGDQVGNDLWHSSPQCPDCGHYFTNATAAVNVATAVVAVEAAPVIGIEGAVALGPDGPIFGTRFMGNDPLLNAGNNLRIGWSYIRSTGEYVFRIGGDWLKPFMDNPHINLWPPSWWGGPPGL